MAVVGKVDPGTQDCSGRTKEGVEGEEAKGQSIVVASVGVQGRLWNERAEAERAT